MPFFEELAYRSDPLTDFHAWWHNKSKMQLMQIDPLDRYDRKKFEISKIQDGSGHHLEKSKTDISPPWFERFRQNLAHSRIALLDRSVH